mgnify:CR=1 FL=1
MKKFLKGAVAVLAAVIGVATFAGCGSAKTKIGSQSGTTGFYYVAGNADMKFPGYSNIESVGYDNAGLAVKAMENGGVDYVVVDSEVGKSIAKTNPNVKVVDIALTTEVYAFGVDKNQPELLTKVNAFLAKIKADGTLNAIYEKYASVSSDDDGNTTGDSDAIQGIASAKKDAAKADRQLVVATNAAFAPYEYVKGDKFAGIDMEIAKLLADELGMELVIEDMDFDAVVTSVGKNNVDLAMAGLTVTASREQSVTFSDAYYEGAYQVLLVKKDNTEFDACKTKEDVEAILKNK